MKQDLGKVITEQCYRFTFEKMTMWEEHLRLFVKPKPRWCPAWFYGWCVRLVLQQQTETKNKSALV